MRRLSTREIGARLAHIRASTSQRAFAEELGIPLRTYQNYERGDREPDLRTLEAIRTRGWSLLWLLAGEGPEREKELLASPERGSEAPFDYPSQPLSDEALTIALEFADRCVGDGWLPRPSYARLVRLLYEGVTRGLPVAEVLQLGQRVSRAMEQGDYEDDGEPNLGAAGGGRAG